MVYHSVYHLGSVALEKLIKIEEGLQIPHNRIYKILLSNNLVNHNPKKQKQRKYRKYQRKHSMFLWHGDWKLFRLENIEYWLIAFIDDQFPVMEFMTATQLKNTVGILRKGFNEYGVPDEVVTDKGTHFAAEIQKDSIIIFLQDF